MQDQMSGTFSSITKAMNSTLAAMRSIKGVDLGPEFAQASADIRMAERAVGDLNNGMGDIPPATEQAAQGFSMMGAMSVNAMIGIAKEVARVVGAVSQMSDEAVNTSSRLSMIIGQGESVGSLQQDIFRAAQASRGEYQTTADLVGRLGINAAEVFSSTAESVRFAELLNKQFAISGASTSEMSGATRQLVQALGSGVLRGDELNSIFENAPSIIRTISDYMGVSVGQIRELASEGEITAQIIKESMLESGGAIDEQFKQMDRTLGQLGTRIKNEFLFAVQPALTGAAEAVWTYMDALDEARKLQDSGGISVPLTFDMSGVDTSGVWVEHTFSPGSESGSVTERVVRDVKGFNKFLKQQNPYLGFARSAMDAAVTMERANGRIVQSLSAVELSLNQQGALDGMLGAYQTMNTGLNDMTSRSQRNWNMSWWQVQSNQAHNIAENQMFSDLYAEMLGAGVSEAYLQAIGATGPQAIPLLQGMMNSGIETVLAKEEEWRTAFKGNVDTLVDAFGLDDGSAQAIKDFISGEAGIAGSLKAGIAAADFPGLGLGIAEEIIAGMAGAEINPFAFFGGFETFVDEWLAGPSPKLPEWAGGGTQRKFGLGGGAAEAVLALGSGGDTHNEINEVTNAPITVTVSVSTINEASDADALLNNIAGRLAEAAEASLRGAAQKKRR